MPTCAWSCHVCQHVNAAGSDICSQCQSPAELSAAQIEQRIALAESRQVPAAPTPRGRTFVTWIFIALFFFGGLQFVWYAIVGPNPAVHPNPVVQAYVSSFNWADSLLQLVYGVFSVGIGWMLYKLMPAVIPAVWFYIVVSSLVLGLQLLFRSTTRAFMAEFGMWALLPSYIFWAVILWYLYRLKRQGRLREF